MAGKKKKKAKVLAFPKGGWQNISGTSIQVVYVGDQVFLRRPGTNKVLKLPRDEFARFLEALSRGEFGDHV